MPPLGAGDRAAPVKSKIKAVPSAQRPAVSNPREHMARADARQAAVGRASVSANNQGNVAKVTTVPAVQPGPIEQIAPVTAAASTNPADYNALQDETFIAQNSAYDDAMKQYIKNQELEQGNYTTNFDKGITDLGIEKTKSLEDLLEDYAARGLGSSGVYDQARVEMENQYGGRETGLRNAADQFTKDLSSQLTGYQAQQKASKENDRLAAVQRLMARATGAA